MKCFLSTLRRKNLERQQSAIIVDLCLTNTRPRKSRDYHDVIEKFRFQNVFRLHENEKSAFSNFSSLKSVFEQLLLREGFSNVDGKP